jgi:hypothetical protein
LIEFEPIMSIIALLLISPVLAINLPPTAPPLDAGFLSLHGSRMASERLEHRYGFVVGSPHSGSIFAFFLVASWSD